MILGITGGSGCGKTTLLSCIAEKGGLVLDCDAIYHRLLDQDAKLLSQLEAAFPGCVENGKLQRKLLGSRVFSDPAALAQLNAITHARVKEAVLSRLAEKPGLACIDAIALFEGGLAELCDKTVAVTAPEADRIRRLCQRDGITREYALARIHAQHPESWFIQRCDYLLENSGTVEQFREKCDIFMKNLLKETCL